MKAKDKARELIDKAKDCKWEYAEYVIDNITAKNIALMVVKLEYYSLRGQLFNLKSCGIDISEKVYLHRLQELIDEEQEVKKYISYE